MKILFVIVVSILNAFTLAGMNQEYGLEFVTYPDSKENYTGLSLNEGKPISTSGNTFEMSFEMYTRDTHVFGDVFRLITDKGQNIDLRYMVDAAGYRKPILVTADIITEIPSPAEGHLNRWIDVSITIKPRTGEIHLKFDGTETTIQDKRIKGTKDALITFGYSNLKGFTIDDVASVNIRDIKIFKGSRLINHWELSTHDSDLCIDNIKGIPAIATNPRWMLDQSVTWSHRLNMEFTKEPCITFDSKEKFYITANGTELYTYDISDNTTDTTAVTGIYPCNGPNQLIWLEDKGTIMSYNLNENSYALLDFNKKEWTGGTLPVKEHDYWNNAVEYDEKTSTLYSFGGYGHYRYNNTLIEFPLGKKPERITISDITPRYAPTCCIVDSLMYVFGGRGNASGKQELSATIYYDLYSVNLNTYKVTKLYELKEGEHDSYVPGNGMIYDKDSDCFYFLANLDGFTLFKLKRTEPVIETMSLPVNINSDFQYTYICLYKDSKGDLYTSITRSDAIGNSTIDIYQMSYPTLSVNYITKSLSETDKAGMKPSSVSAIIASVVLLLMTAAAFIAFWLRRKKASPKHINAHSTNLHEIIAPDFGRSSICLLGGFKVKDKNGNDITAAFTPTLKFLTTLLILHSEKYEHGIMGNKLNSLLWPYKPEESANNNRNVYISKLRALMDEIGDIKIINSNKFWSIQFCEGTRCDYLEAMRISKSESPSAADTDMLLSIMLKGMILPNLEEEWADKFKSDYSNMAIDFLTQQLKRTDLHENTLIKITDTIFQQDYLNEEALHAKCSILCRQGKTGLSKEIYDKFCMEYKDSIGMDYAIKFKQIIES